MGNRKKAKKPYLRLAADHGRTVIQPKGLANITVSGQGDAPAELFDQFQKLDIPEDEKYVVKEVPAMVKGVEVGTAEVYHDGTVGVRIHPDAPGWALELIKAELGQVSYSIGEGDGPA